MSSLLITVGIQRTRRGSPPWPTQCEIFLEGQDGSTDDVDAEPTRSCSLPISSLTSGQKIVTIEGLVRDSTHALQKAWVTLDVPRCGYCQSGQIMAAAEMPAVESPTIFVAAPAVLNAIFAATGKRIRDMPLKNHDLRKA